MVMIEYFGWVVVFVVFDLAGGEDLRDMGRKNHFSYCEIMVVSQGGFGCLLISIRWMFSPVRTYPIQFLPHLIRK